MKRINLFWGPITALFLFSALPVGAANLQLVSALDSPNNIAATANGDSACPIMTPDGRYVLFASAANNLVLTNLNGPVPSSSAVSHSLNVYRRDRTGNTTVLVSVNPSGNGGNSSSVPMGISADGRYALFESTATDLAPSNTNCINNVFVRDIVASTTTLVSINTNGIGTSTYAGNSVMTPDGRFVAFVSAARDIAPNTTNGIRNVFVRDLQAGTTTLVTGSAVATTPVPFPSASGSPVITPDGRYVAYESTGFNLVPGGTLAGDVYVWDRVAGTTTWVSTNARSLFQLIYPSRVPVSFSPVISTDGVYVAYVAGTNALNSLNGYGLVLRYNTRTQVTDVIYTNAYVPFGLAPSQQDLLAMTPDGRFVTLLANGAGTSGYNTVYLWDAQTGSNVLVSADLSTGQPVVGVCEGAMVNPSGRFIAFFCDATNLTGDPLVGGTHLYLRDVVAETTQLIDINTNGVGVGAEEAYDLSADGRFVAFDLYDSSVAANDNNRDSDVFVRDVPAGTNEVISVHDPLLPSQVPNFFSYLFSSSVSTNGRYVCFSSDADNIVSDDTNGLRDVFVRDLLSGTNILASTGLNGIALGGNSTEPSISGDGTLVAFSSMATNLVATDPNGFEDVFLRNLQTGTTVLISVSTTGGPANGDSYQPTLSANGQYVLFRSVAQNLAPGISGSPVENFFIRNLSSGTTYALTVASGVNVSMTPDGHYVAFIGVAPGTSAIALYVWNSQTASAIYTNTSAAMTDVTISPDGRWIAYVSGTNLYAVDLASQTNYAVAAGPYNDRSGLQFSADDRFLVFSTKGTLVSADTNATYDIYLHDFQSGANLLVSKCFNSTNAANRASDWPSISADGRFVTYHSSATNSVPNDANGLSDIFLYDRVSNETTLLSVDQAGTGTANSVTLEPEFSGDGKTVTFQSFASNLPGASFNETSAIYLSNLSSVTDTNSTGSNSTLSAGLQFGTNSQSGQSPILTWQVSSGESYQVQFKDNLSDPAWQNLQGNVVLFGTTGYAIDLAPSASQRFYRIVASQ